MSGLKNTGSLLEDLKNLPDNEDKKLLEWYAEKEYVKGGMYGSPFSNMAFRSNLQNGIEWFGTKKFQEFRDFVSKIRNK